MIYPHIVDEQNLAVNFKFMIQPGHGKMIDPYIVADQNLTKKFKFKI